MMIKMFRERWIEREREKETLPTTKPKLFIFHLLQPMTIIATLPTVKPRLIQTFRLITIIIEGYPTPYGDWTSGVI